MQEAVFVVTMDTDSGFGEVVPCLIDDNTWEIVEFRPALSRRYDTDERLSAYSWKSLYHSGRCVEPMTQDMFDELVDECEDKEGWLRAWDDRETGNIVICNYYQLEDAFRAMVILPNFDISETASGNCFGRCAQLAATVSDEDDACSYAENLAWSGCAHLRDAALLMCEVMENVWGDIPYDPSIYNETLDKGCKYVWAFNLLYERAVQLAQQMEQDFSS